MSSQNIMVVAVIVAVAIAVVALLVALLAVRRLRQFSPPRLSSDAAWPETMPQTQPSHATGEGERAIAIGDQSAQVPAALQARVVEGRVVMTPTSRQIVDATMGRPLIKASILAHGLAHALRPESRDRIRALMRREYNRSRNQRRRVARQAARTHTTSAPTIDPRTGSATKPGRHAATVDAHAWLGELPQRPSSPGASGRLEGNR